MLLEPNHSVLSIATQCELLGLARSSFYYTPQPIDELSLTLMNLIDEEYTRHPFIGTRRMTAYLRTKGYQVNRKRIQNLYRQMAIEAIYPKRNLSKQNASHKVYPYLLKGVNIEHCNQVWSTDITYIRLKKGFMYLIAIIDWYSRFVLDWELSNTLEADFCVEILKRVLRENTCEIFNTDRVLIAKSSLFFKKSPLMIKIIIFLKQIYTLTLPRELCLMNE